MTYKYQLLSLDGTPEGTPYRYIGRALMRIEWLRSTGQGRYTLVPVRVRSMSTILQFPITRPTFDDANLGNEGLWIFDNAARLARWWQVLGNTLGIDDRDGEEDLELFCREQHLEQMRNRVGFMLPHGSSL